MLINPSKPWDLVDRELAEYRSVYRETHGREAPPPVVEIFTVCHSNPERAEELARTYLGRFYNHDPPALRVRRGPLRRESRATSSTEKMSKILQKSGEQGATDFFLELQPWGTPDQCIEQIEEIHKKINFGHLNVTFGFADMPAAEATAGMQLFAQEVLPAVKKIEAGALV